MTSGGSQTERYDLETEMTVDEALTAVGRAAEHWGAEWSRSGNVGRIHLPVNAGVRAGLLTGRVEIAAGSEARNRVSLGIEESRYEVNKQAVALLVAGALSGVVLMLWPFFPILLGFAPLAIVLAFIAWFVVGSRLRNNGPREFLDLVAEHSPGPTETPSA